ncbi:MAG: TCR/Tet family MFS transporter [Bacteroidales bacterium]|nr:TCR/Tet family MFS transporter [Bacteroidales bacterium]
MQKSSKASISFIFITILIDVIGIGVIIPVLPSLIQELTGGGLSDASKIGGWLIFSYALMQFVFAPVLGAISDKVGRRPVLLIALFGLGIDYLIHAVAPTIAWLFLGRILAGIAGASITTASAYIADISSSEKRAQNFGMIGAAFGLGFIIGPVIGGVFSQWGVRMPFYFSAGLSFVNFLYGYIVLPESLSKENRRKFDWKRANPLGTLKQLKKNPVISGFVLSFVLLYMAGHSLNSTWSFFTMYKFSWTETQVGYSLGVVGVMVALVQGGLIRVVVPYLGDKRAVIIGFLFWISGMLAFAFANEGWMMYAILVPYCLGGIAGPTLQGIMSNQVHDNEQGELQGGLTSLVSLTSIIGPLIMTNAFAFFTKDDTPVEFAGAPFFLGAIFLTLSLILIVKKLGAIDNLKPARSHKKHQL